MSAALRYLTPEDHALLERTAEVRHFKQNDQVLAEGAAQRDLFIIRKGIVRVERLYGGSWITIATLKDEDIFGEMSLVEEADTSASVVADSNVDLLILHKPDLDELMRLVPGFALRFYQSIAFLLSRRLRETTRMLPSFMIEDIPHVRNIHDERTGDGNLIKVPQGFVSEVQNFKEVMMAANQSLAKGSMASESQDRVSKACQSLNDAVSEFVSARPELAKSIGTYALRETFPYLMLSRLMDRSFNKPRGYAGDYYTIHMIYENQPQGDGRLGPLIDRWALSTNISQANRDRLIYIGDLVRDLLRAWSNHSPMPITSLASGSSRELIDVFQQNPTANFYATCIDIDPEAANFAASTAMDKGVSQHFRFAVDNAVRLVLGHGKVKIPPQNLIYTLGLIDYLQDKVVVRLLNWMHDQLLSGGTAVIGNHDPSNPNRAMLEHVLDWGILYRTGDDLQRLFSESKFGMQNVDVTVGSSGVQVFARCRKV